MKTNFEGMKEIIQHYMIYSGVDIKRGFCDKREIDLITNELSLKEKSLIELRNCRDFAVLLVSSNKNSSGVFPAMSEETIMDMISAVTSVIDNEIWMKGGEV